MRRRIPLATQPRQAISWGKVLIITLGASGVVALISGATQAVLTTDEGGAAAVDAFNDTFATQQTLGGWAWSFLSIAIAGPIVEEIIFRGIAFHGAMAIRGGWFPIVASAVIFGVWHMSPVQIPYTIVLGLVFATMYQLSGRLWVPMVMHIINNGMQTLPPALDTDVMHMVVAVLGIVCIIPAVLMLRGVLRGNAAMRA